MPPRFMIGVDDHRERDDEAREPHLAQQALPVDKAAHAVRRRLAEELEEHEAEEDVDAVVLDAGVETGDLREDQVDHAEEQERTHERPHVAEHGAVEAQLELGERQRPGQTPEALQVVPEDGRPLLLEVDGGAHGSRSTSMVCGMSTMPSNWRKPWTISERTFSRTSSASPGPASECSERGREVVPARGEPVLHPHAEDGRVAGVVAPGVGHLAVGRRGEDRVADLVAQVEVHPGPRRSDRRR